MVQYIGPVCERSGARTADVERTRAAPPNKAELMRTLDGQNTCAYAFRPCQTLSSLASLLTDQILSTSCAIAGSRIRLET